MSENRVIMWVPNGHPFEGHSMMLYPDNGATTYIEGIVEFRSQRSEGVKELRQSLTELGEKLKEMNVAHLENKP